jgi:hypothetical protein
MEEVIANKTLEEMVETYLKHKEQDNKKYIADKKSGASSSPKKGNIKLTSDLVSERKKGRLSEEAVTSLIAARLANTTSKRKASSGADYSGQQAPPSTKKRK